MRKWRGLHLFISELRESVNKNGSYNLKGNGRNDNKENEIKNWPPKVDAKITAILSFVCHWYSLNGKHINKKWTRQKTKSCSV